MKTKCYIKILMVDYIDNQPGFAKCMFQNGFGDEIIIYEKIPVLTTRLINQETPLPTTLDLPGFIDSVEYETKTILNFTTDHNIEDNCGNNHFMIKKEDLIIHT
ncbi:hypothetical protein GBO36_03640 [Roseivirga pacifica]|nr:hypothetical protein [Roseivirga pacifica]